jgi:small-conductance mechanosensitive channel
MRMLHRTLDRVDVPPLPGPLKRPDFRLAIGSSVLAIAALVTTEAFGDIHSRHEAQKLTAVGGAAAFLVFGVLAVRSVGNQLHRSLAPRAGMSHASVVRLLIDLVGYALVLVLSLGLLAVPIGQLVLGGALTGVVIGIAAQQALGNVFAGLVLLIARPFNIGDDICLRSGTFGGQLTGRVSGMGLTYLTLMTPTGPISIPNSGVLAAGVGPAARE